MIAGMQERLIRALSGRSRDIHRRWEELLRLELPATPLADPDALVHLIDWTLDRVLNELRSRRAYRASEPNCRVAALRACCSCGHNPFIKHFLAGEQALLEALVLVQSEEPSQDPVHRDTAVAELYLTINEIARGEVESLCSMCRNRPRPRTGASFAAEAAVA
jgi:hypothetical protein